MPGHRLYHPNVTTRTGGSLFNIQCENSGEATGKSDSAYSVSAGM